MGSMAAGGLTGALFKSTGERVYLAMRGYPPAYYVCS